MDNNNNNLNNMISRKRKPGYMEKLGEWNDKHARSAGLLLVDATYDSEVEEDEEEVEEEGWKTVVLTECMVCECCKPWGDGIFCHVCNRMKCKKCMDETNISEKVWEGVTGIWPNNNNMFICSRCVQSEVNNKAM